MAFVLHTSNKTENLFEHLATVLSTPLPSVFDKDVFLIQSQGMERWLLQGLSDRFGVFANYEFLFPNTFFNTIARQICPGLNLRPEAFTRERLVWVVDAVLADIDEAQDVAFPEVLNYLADAASENRRFQLAQQLTQLFDQYQVFRPKMMDEPQPSHWSLQIWRRVLTRVGDERHVGRAWSELINHLQEPGLPRPNGLPSRISIFGIHSMPVVFVHVLQALARHVDVHLYLTQPTSGFWGDLRGRSEVVRDKLRRVFVNGSVEEDADTMNHPLLSLQGQQGQDFHRLLLQEVQFDWEFDSFDERADSTLEQLQMRILNNEASAKIPLIDQSIQCVSCHSRMREVQVLKDFILRSLQDDKSLQLRDIVVMAPNIADYEPYIAAVFYEAELPFAIADKSLRGESQVYGTLLALLKMLGGRFEWTAVLDLLGRAPIRELLKLEDRDLEQIQLWVEATSTRWGRSAEHKASLGLPALQQNTWEAGLQQIMLGFAMQGQHVSIEGSQAQLLANLDGFVRTVLFATAESCEAARSLLAWRDWLVDLITLLFDAQSAEVQLLNRSLDILAEVDVDAPYPLAAVIAWLEETVAERKSSQGFMAGQLTFCSMLPMRSIPFKVIAVLGMNDGEYPRQDRRPSFDLMADDFQIGDRSIRIDDRYQFLEILLSARQTLYLSYVGQSQKRPQDIPPSVVLQELLDELAFEEQEFPQKQPLQPFSPAYFRADSRLRTFDKSAFHTALALRHKPIDEPVWIRPEQRLPALDSNLIDLHDFLTFAADPQRWFVRNRLGLALSQVSADMQVHESFKLNGLERFQLEQRILELALAGQPAASIHQQLMESGQWPSGAMGSIQLRGTIEQVEVMAEALQDLPLGAAGDPAWVDVSIGDCRVEGAISAHFTQGFLQARYASLKAKDFIRAGLVNAMTDECVHLLGLSKERQVVYYGLSGLSLDLPLWLQRYREAFAAPPEFWPQLGWVWLTSFHDPKKKNKSDEEREAAAEKAVRGEWDQLMGTAYEAKRADVHVMRIAQGYNLEDIWTPAVREQTLGLLDPLHAVQREDEE